MANNKSKEVRPRNERIRVVIADDHPVVREGLRIMMRRSEIELVGEAATGSEAVELVREMKPHVVLMDVRMPDMDGLEATAIIKKEAPSTSVIIITSQERKDYLRRAIEAGAAGFMLKEMSRDVLCDAVKLVKSGGSLIDANLLAELLQEMGSEESYRPGGSEGALEALSPREQQVLQQVAAGLTNREIAEQVHCSVGTVKNVVQRIIEKMGVSDRTQAAVLAVRTGLLVN